MRCRQKSSTQRIGRCWVEESITNIAPVLTKLPRWLVLFMICCSIESPIAIQWGRKFVNNPRSTISHNIEVDSDSMKMRKISTSVTLMIRGGGRGSDREQTNHHFASLIDSMTSAGSTIASVWKKDCIPTLKTWKEVVIVRLESIRSDILEHGEKHASKNKSSKGLRRIVVNDEVKGRGAATKSSSNESNDASSEVSSMTSMFMPSRIIKLSIVAFLLAEGLDRIGILYEDAPAILKSQLINLWKYNVHPFLMKCKTRLQIFYWNQIEPYLPQAIVDAFDDFAHSNSNQLGSLFTTTKVAFAIGASLGMIVSPLLVQTLAKYWKPFLGLYTLAEFNHFCKQKGYKLAHLLGETPQTFGVTLDGILEQCRSIIRRTVLGESAHETHALRPSSGPSILASDQQWKDRSKKLSLLGGADTSSTNKHQRDIGYSLGPKPSTTTDSSVSKAEISDLQSMLDDFKGWMVVHTSSHESEKSLSNTFFGDFFDSDLQREKREMVKQGFWVGCALGFTMLGI